MCRRLSRRRVHVTGSSPRAVTPLTPFCHLSREEISSVPWPIPRRQIHTLTNHQQRPWPCAADTANVYEKGMSEKWLGEFLASQRSRAVIATKFGGCTDGSDPNAGGNHRKIAWRSRQ